MKINFRNSRLVSFFAIFTLFFLVFSFCYLSVNTLSSGDDHFFHFRFADSIREDGLLESFHNFQGIYFTRMVQGGEYFIYYNFLFYFLISLISIAPTFLAIKMYAIFAVSITFAVLYLCLRMNNIKWGGVWTITFFSITSVPILIRFLTSRPFTLAPIILLLLLVTLHKKKFFWTFFICVLYLFWHSSTFFFPLIIMFTYSLFESFFRKKVSVKNIIYSVSGIVVSLAVVYLIAPNFLLFIYDTVFGIYTETILGNKVSLPEGNELYKADLSDFVRVNYLLISAFIFAITYFLYRYFVRRFKSKDFEFSSDDVIEGASFFLSISFFLGTVVLSRRFQDFFYIFSMFFIALSLSKLLINIEIKDLVAKRAIIVGFLISLFYLFLSNVLTLQSSLANGANVDRFKEIGIWMDNNIPKGEVIFNASWNWFPQLYYHSPTHNYVIGLEPRFLYVYSHSLYWKWHHIGYDGYVCKESSCPKIKELSDLSNRKSSYKDTWNKDMGEEIANTIINDFKSHYIVSSRTNPSLNNVLNNSSRFKQVVSSNNDVYLYKILDK